MPVRHAANWLYADSFPGVIRDPASINDLSTGLNAAIASTRDQKKTLVLRGGTYIVDDQVLGRDLGIGRMHFGEPNIRIIAYPGDTVTIKLHPTLSLPNFAAAKPMVYLARGAASGVWPPTSVAPEQYPVVFGAWLDGIIIDTSGVPNAIGLQMQAHQTSSLRNIKVIATGSLKGIVSVPGVACFVNNIEVIGGLTQLEFQGHYDTHRNIGVVMTDVRLSEHDAGGRAIRITGGRSSTTIAGGLITSSRHQEPLIEIPDPIFTAASNAYLHTMQLNSCRVEFTGAAAGTAITNVSRRGVMLTECQFGNCATVLRNGSTDGDGDDVAGTSGGVHHIESYRYLYTTQNGLPCKTVTNGVRAAVTGAETHTSNGTVGGFTSGLVERVRVPRWNLAADNVVWANEAWNGLPAITPSGPHVSAGTAVNVAPLLQEWITAAATDRKHLHLPWGAYGIGQELIGYANTVISFGAGYQAYLSVTDAWAASETDATKKVLRMPDDVDATYQLWDLNIDTISFRTGNRIGALHHGGGRNTIVVWGKLEYSGSRACEIAKLYVTIGTYGGGRHYAYQDHSRVSVAPDLTGRIVPGFRQMYMAPGSEPMTMYGMDNEQVLGAGPAGSNPVWPASYDEAVWIDGRSNFRAVGTKFEANEGPLIRVSGNATNIEIEHMEVINAQTPLIRPVSPAQVCVGQMMLPTAGAGVLLVDETGYSVMDDPNCGEVVRYRRGPQMDYSPFPFTFEYPPDADTQDWTDLPTLTSVSITLFGETAAAVCGLSGFEIIDDATGGNVATVSGNVSSVDVTDAANLVDGNAATYATVTGSGRVVYDLSGSPKAIRSLKLIARTGTTVPVSFIAKGIRSDTGRVRTLASGSLAGLGTELVFDCIAPFSISAARLSKAAVLEAG